MVGGVPLYLPLNGRRSSVAPSVEWSEEQSAHDAYIVTEGSMEYFALIFCASVPWGVFI